MADRLSAIWPDVHHYSIALREVLLPRQLAGDAMQMTDQGLLVLALAHLSQRSNVLLRNHQHMHRRRRVDVRKGQRLLVFIELLCGNLAVGDLAEDAIRTHALSMTRDTASGQCGERMARRSAYDPMNRGWCPALHGS